MTAVRPKDSTSDSSHAQGERSQGKLLNSLTRGDRMPDDTLYLNGTKEFVNNLLTKIINSNILNYKTYLSNNIERPYISQCLEHAAKFY